MCSMEPILAEDQCPYRAPLCVENLELPSGGFSVTYTIVSWMVNRYVFSRQRDDSQGQTAVGEL